MKYIILPKMRLNLFDGGAAGAAAGGNAAAAAPAADVGADDGAKGETKARPGNTRRGRSGEYDNVRFGKQADASADDTHETAPAAGEQTTDVKVTSNTLEEKRKAYRDLVSGEYRDVYTEDTQRIINRRFAEVKGLESQIAQYQPVIDMLMQRYGVADDDVAKLMTAIESDSAYWSAAADEAGMSVEQYKRMQQLERENAALMKQQRQERGRQAMEQQLNRWAEDAESLKKVYPSFNLSAELQNEQFKRMLRAGVPMQHAYEVAHMDDIKAGVARMQAEATEKQVVEGIRARGTRPPENGASSQSSFVVRDDVSKLSKADRAEIARRAKRGEKITF